MLFTNNGISGPAVLSLSSRINKTNLAGAKIAIDLKPALDAVKLDARILRDFSERMNKDFVNSLDQLLPERLRLFVAERCGIPLYKKVNQITAQDRKALISTLKGLTFTNVSLDSIEYGIVTSGGVDVTQISPSTMESKIVKGLYFAGEVLDIDALTGGYNSQLALSTGYVAGMSASKEW
jgi:predicted Rossmann fold flavoprotein